MRRGKFAIRHARTEIVIIAVVISEYLCTSTAAGEIAVEYILSGSIGFVFGFVDISRELQITSG